MKNLYIHSRLLALGVCLFVAFQIKAQTVVEKVNHDTTEAAVKLNDSINSAVLDGYTEKLAEAERERVADSTRRAKLETQLMRLNDKDNSKKEELIKELEFIKERDQKRIAAKKASIDSLRSTVKGYPVMGVLKDTLFLIYTKLGSLKAKERADIITRKVRQLYENDFLNVDSILVLQAESTYDIVYGDLIVMSVSEDDALWYGQTIQEFSTACKDKIVKAIELGRYENSWMKLTQRIGLVLLVITIVGGLFWLIGKGHHRMLKLLFKHRKKWLRDLTYKNYTFITAAHEMRALVVGFKVLRIIVCLLLIYLTLPILFSIFPFSRDWANALFHLIWSPFRRVLMAVWHFMPNLFSILVIYFVMKYVIRFARYIFREIGSGKLQISGFHPDWALPTYSIIKFLLYAFMFVLLFPYLPGSDSSVFRGVSVFVGVLFSLGSSSAISNMVTGLVITYMRPFQIGDRIKIGDAVGDVVEKTLLVTRIRTIKNELITIPNSSVLSGNTINYTSEAKERGLIMYATVTFGYEWPWQEMHKALIDAALRTKYVLHNPKPFVLQTGLDDFYVSYQINVYTREASKQALIYSDLRRNVLDVCNERGIEILSPHYRAHRDGSTLTFPPEFVPKDQANPIMKVQIEKEDDK